MATFDGSDVLNKIPEALQCVICLDHLCDAHLCRHCSKMCCFKCITKWMTDHQNQCPHCRADLQLQDLIKCRWGEELTEQLVQLLKNEAAQKTALEELAQQLREKEKTNEELRQRIVDKDENKLHERCKSHGRKIKIYCNDCETKLCQFTALWSEKHKGHTLKSLQEAYDENAGLVKEGLSQLQERLDYLTAKIISCEEYSTQFMNEKERISKIINEKIDLILDKALAPLNDRNVRFSKELNEIRSKIEDVESLLRVTCLSEFLEKCPKLLRSVQDAVRDSINETIPSELPDFMRLLASPYSYASMVFLIKRFSKLGNNRAKSNVLFACGGEWQLEVYPKGNLEARDQYLSVYLRLLSLKTSASSETIKVDSCIGIINQKSKSNDSTNERELCHSFKVGTSWGWPYFYNLGSLASDGYHDVESDTVKMIVQVRENLD